MWLPASESELGTSSAALGASLLAEFGLRSCFADRNREAGDQPLHNWWERHRDVSPDLHLPLSDGNIAVRFPFLNSKRLMYFCKLERTADINHKVYLH